MTSPRAGATATCEVVTTRDGARAMLDHETGEVMHPVVGPLVEAARLYVTPSRLAERLAAGSAKDEPLVLLDVGLGAGSNAIAAWRVAEALPATARRLSIVSFEKTLAPFALALDDANAKAFGFEGEALAAGRALLANCIHKTERASWRLVVGSLPGVLEAEAENGVFADAVFWDPFSPRSNPALWTAGAFTSLRRLCREGATVNTYSGATATRSAMLLGGFAVGFGETTGDNKQATVGAVGTNARIPAWLERPLDARWLARLARSSAAFPSDAPWDALARIAAMPQFQPS